MSTNHDDQRAARTRMEVAGESYTAALRNIRGERFPGSQPWAWPNTVIPADLRLDAIPTGAVSLYRPTFSGAGAAFDPQEAIVRAGMLASTYCDGMEPAFRPSRSASGLIRARLKRMVADGERHEWRLRVPAIKPYSVRALTPLEALTRDERPEPSLRDCAVVVAQVEEAMRQAAPAGFSGVLPYGSPSNRAFHRALFGLAGKLVAADRHDDALIVVENHLWLWPDGFIYTEILWGLLDALQIPGIGPKRRGPTEAFAAEHLASLPGRRSRMTPLRPDPPVEAAVIDPMSIIDPADQLAVATRLIPLVEGWLEHGAAVVIDMLGTMGRMLWPRQIGGRIDSTAVGDAVGAAIAAGASAQGVLDCLVEWDACLGGNWQLECIPAIAASNLGNAYYIAPPPMAALFLRRAGKRLGQVGVPSDLASSITALVGRLLRDSFDARFDVRPITDILGGLTAEFATTGDEALLTAAECVEDAAIVAELYVLGVAEKSWGSIAGGWGETTASVVRATVLPALYGLLETVDGAIDQPLAAALARAQLVWDDAGAAEHNASATKRQRRPPMNPASVGS